MVFEIASIGRLEMPRHLDIAGNRLGNALMKLEEKMAELKVTFGLSDEQLNMKLGPLKMWE